MKNCIVAQSGGPSCAINASLAGVIQGVLDSKEYDRIYGLINGITGVLNDSYMDLTEKFEGHPEELELLKTTPAMFLGSCRFKLKSEEEDPEFYENIFKFFDEHEVAAFFYIGGNDSMDTVDKLSAYGKKHGKDVKVVGVPKTIDNDLCEIDHTPGFGSAAKYVASTILELAHDTAIYKMKSVLIVEVMGRDAGWLTAGSCLARTEYSSAPHLIYLPEVAFDQNEFVSSVKALLEKQDVVIVAVSEGIRDKDGKYISASGDAVDKFGHVMLNGAGQTLKNVVEAEIGCKVRSIELNIAQRCGAESASATDLEEGFLLGKNAVELAEAGVTAVMSRLVRVEGSEYKVEYGSAPVNIIANAVKEVPREWINEAGNDVTPEMREYLLPLIQGEVKLKYKDGLPLFADISHLYK